MTLSKLTPKNANQTKCLQCFRPNGEILSYTLYKQNDRVSHWIIIVTIVTPWRSWNPIPKLLFRWWQRWQFLAAKGNSHSRGWCTGQNKEQNNIKYVEIHKSKHVKIKTHLRCEYWCQYQTIPVLINCLIIFFRQHYEFWLVAHTEVNIKMKKS